MQDIGLNSLVANIKELQKPVDDIIEMAIADSK
jgi:hypothetical protein